MVTSTPSRSGLTPWIRRGPLAGLRHELDDLLERFWSDEAEGWSLNVIAPAMDLSETDKALQVRMDLPGVDPKQIDITVRGNRLTISGEKKEEKEEKGETYHRIERRAGRFARSIQLPGKIREEQIDAKYKDGILTVTLPKTAEAQTRRVEVKS